MSSPAGERSAPVLEHLRKEAKHLLRACREGDDAAWARVRARLPRLAALAPGEARDAIQLADVHQCLALERDHESWAVMLHAAEATQGLAERVARFLESVRNSDVNDAQHAVREDPEIASFDAFTAACFAIADLVSAASARDPSVVHATRGGEGWTPLQYLCHAHVPGTNAAVAEASARCAKILLAAGADANVSTQPEGDALVRLPALWRACVNDNVAVVKLLLEYGANPNDDESMYHAAELDHRACLDLLVAHGGLVDGRRESHWNNTPLFFLAGYLEGHHRAAAATSGMLWLLEHGADPNIPSGDARNTPLLVMIGNGRSVEAIRMLLDHGADPSQARADGLTPYVGAVRTGNLAIAELLVARGATASASPIDEFLGACMRADTASARAALARDPGLMERLSPADRRAPVRAAGQNLPDAIRLMGELGFDLGLESPDGGTPLHFAAWHGWVEMARLLIALGAPLNTRDSTYGSSPIAWAAHGSRYCRSADEDYLAIVDALLDAGAAFETSVNRWHEPPDAFASERVAARLRERGFGRKG